MSSLLLFHQASLSPFIFIPHQPHPLTGSKVFSSCSLLTVILKAIVNILLKSFLIAKMKTISNFKSKLVTNAGRILEVSIWQNSQLHPQTVNWQKVQIINYKWRTFSQRLQYKYQRRLISKNSCSTKDQEKKNFYHFGVFFCHVTVSWRFHYNSCAVLLLGIKRLTSHNAICRELWKWFHRLFKQRQVCQTEGQDKEKRAL